VLQRAHGPGRGRAEIADRACHRAVAGRALAARVLDEALDAGFKGAMIATQPKGVGGNLDDPSLDPFWEVASARQAAIFLHPHYICGDERLADYDLVNAVGRLADTTIAVARLLFSGHLTRFPGVNLLLS